jgi:uncharacterized protein
LEIYQYFRRNRKGEIKFYLNASNKKIQDEVNSGELRTDLPNNNAPAEYTYNPNDTLSIYKDTDNYLTNRSFANNVGDKGLVYHTEKFEEDKEVSGFFELNAYIEMDVKDVDIYVVVNEIKTDGTKVDLTGQTLRARHKDNIENEKLIVPNEVNLFEFKNFHFISRVIEKGSRLQVVITSSGSDQKNYCSGGKVINETAKDAKIARIKIHNNNKFQSVLLVPYVK